MGATRVASQRLRPAWSPEGSYRAIHTLNLPAPPMGRRAPGLAPPAGPLLGATSAPRPASC